MVVCARTTGSGYARPLCGLNAHVLYTHTRARGSVRRVFIYFIFFFGRRALCAGRCSAYYHTAYRTDNIFFSIIITLYEQCGTDRDRERERDRVCVIRKITSRVISVSELFLPLKQRPEIDSVAFSITVRQHSHIVSIWKCTRKLSTQKRSKRVCTEIQTNGNMHYRQRLKDGKYRKCPLSAMVVVAESVGN